MDKQELGFPIENLEFLVYRHIKPFKVNLYKLNNSELNDPNSKFNNDLECFELVGKEKTFTDAINFANQHCNMIEKMKDEKRHVLIETIK